MKNRQKTLEQMIYEQAENLDKEIVYEIINKLQKRFNRINLQELNPITIEIAMNNEEEVLKLIKQGININEINTIGLTPLLTAIYFNHPNIVELLVKNGADVNFKGKNNIIPLLFACDKGNDRICTNLLENGAHIHELDDYGYNALQHTIAPRFNTPFNIKEYVYSFPHKIEVNNNPMSKLNIIDLLINYGIDINYINEQHNILTEVLTFNQDTYSINALTLALMTYSKDYSKIIEKLINNGAERIAYEIHPEIIYEYQDSFNFIEDIKDMDLSCWPKAPLEYLFYLKYKHIIKKYGIEVFTKTPDDGYRRPKLIKKL